MTGYMTIKRLDAKTWERTTSTTRAESVSFVAALLGLASATAALPLEFAPVGWQRLFVPRLYDQHGFVWSFGWVHRTCGRTITYPAKHVCRPTAHIERDS